MKNKLLKMNYKQQLAVMGSGIGSFLFLFGFAKSAVYKGKFLCAGPCI